MTRSRLGVPGLVARHLRVGVTASILLALLVALSTLAASLAPRALATLDSAQLRHTVAALPPGPRDLSATGVFGSPTVQDRPPVTAAETFGAFSSALDRFSAEASHPLSAVLGHPQWVVRTAAHAADPIDGRALPVHPVITLAVDLDWSSRVRIVDGATPTPWTGRDTDELDPTARTPIDIALSADAATAAHLRLGDLLSGNPAPLRIAALYAPKDPADAFWAHQPDLARGNIFQSSGGGFLLYADAFVDPESAVGLRDTLASATFSAWFPIRVDRLRFTDAAALSTQARQLSASGSQLTTAQSATFAWGLPAAITAVDRRIALVTSLLALTASGPIGVVLAVFALGVQSVIGRRRAALNLVRSRGGSATQVRLVGVLEGVLISVPAAALGLLVAGLIVPGDLAPATLAVPALFAIAPPLLFALFATRSADQRRSDLRVRSRSSTRWVAEVAVIGLAALSLFLLARRGLARASLAVGVDPLLVATPLLLSLAVCLIVLRLYPALMSAVHRAARSGRGGVGLVGAARATRTPALGFIAALALIVGISTAVFSTVLSTTVGHALDSDARLAVGADLRVEASHLDSAIQDRVAGVGGVRAAAAFQRIPDVPIAVAGVPATVTVVVAQLDQLHRVRPDLAVSSAGGFSVYLSHELAHDLGSRSITVNGHSATIAGELPSNALPALDTVWVLIDAANADQVETAFAPDALLVSLDPGANGAATATAVADAVRTGHNDDTPTDVEVIQARHVRARDRRSGTGPPPRGARIGPAVDAGRRSRSDLVGRGPQSPDRSAPHPGDVAPPGDRTDRLGAGADHPHRRGRRDASGSR